MYKGSIRVEPPFLYACAFIFLFSIGGFTGLLQGALATDIHIHDTSFIVAHFHYTMFGGTGAMFFGALHYWFPKMFGRMVRRRTAIVAFTTWFVGFNLLYAPLFVAGMKGMPRRYQDYLPEYQGYHQLSTYGSWVMVTGILLMIWNLVVSARKGEPATANPWGGATLEWTVSSPPPTHQFPTIPTVTHDPYDYDAVAPTKESVHV
jgi:cytochrome c oxidase subunit 1